MTSIALTSIAQRAADYTPIQRKNQLSKLCWFASDVVNCNMPKNGNYIIC
ncbi:MAG TPA: hypothetical protein O0X25_01620 [Methanocorpusculum sp.]|nr:hypothetical protein [Methanocorpusculum sp.]HJJ39695.1 hypothetical protein [Methanocorpusculum sp.]HJJ49304.1 hypothetical protein [Methanocorpusculum sp.]HJJ56652.1 hypothetical protein [Methanocorpusculum sp.]